MPSFVSVFCRKSTLLCRQLVRRSMVFSTVQISMPGTSCAAARPPGNQQGATTIDATRAIRPIMEILIQANARTVNLLRANAETGEHTTPKPHSRVEVLRSAPQLWGRRGARAERKRVLARLTETNGMATRER